MTREQFVEQLQQSGILTAESLTLVEEPESSGNETAEQFAEHLIQQKKLTQFQAQTIFQGHGDRLLLGEYLLLDKIGAGGMGQVFLAEHRRMERRVALKTLPETMAQDTQAIHRFHREVQASAKLSHPNIVTAHDAGESKGIHYFVMEYVQGTDLASLVKEHGSLTITQAVNFILQTATGLEYAHNKGIIHRDIKPDNILLDQEGTIKILDMGLARIDNEAGDHAKTQLTQTGNVIGTVNYMSPEQAQDTHAADARSDIYSLGCMLHFLLTGESVYDGDSVINRILAHRDKPIPSLSVKHAHIPPELDAVFQKMVAKQPEDRYQSMKDVISDLQACKIEGVSSVAPIQAITKETVTASSPTRPVSSVDSLDHTVLTDASEVQAESHQTGKGRQRIALAVMLISVFLLALLFINQNTKTDTPQQGTVLLEFDQTELAGAIVTIDGQQQNNIKLEAGTAPIQIAADNQPHTLNVTKAGFEPYTQQFTVEAGKQETIRVRLVPSTPPVQEPQIATENYALDFDGQDDHVLIENFDLPSQSETDQFTVELLCRIPEPIQVRGCSIDVNNTIRLFCPRFDSEGGLWRLLTKSEKDPAIIPFASMKTIPKRFMHFAITWNGKLVRFYTDGKRSGYGNPLAAPLQKHGKKMILAAVDNYRSNQRLSHFFKGSIDELRISNVARYGENFTPQKRFETDPNTLALYHFDEAKGDVLIDSSGNGHHGKKIGAKWVKVADLQTDSINNAIPEFYYIVWKYDGQVLAWDEEKNKHLEIVPQSNLSAEKIGSYTLNFKDLKQFGDDQLIKIADAYRRLSRKRSLSIDLSGTQISAKGINTLAGLPVYGLVLNRNPRIDDDLTASIPQFERLINLSLQETSITDATIKALSSMKSLRKLNLKGTAVTPKCVPHLSKLLIEDLNASITDIDASAVKKLKAALPQCKIIWDGGIVSAKEPAYDPHRRAAEIVLQRGGRVKVSTATGIKQITELKQLPQTRFALYLVFLSENTTMTIADWKVFEEINWISDFSFASAPISPAGLMQLKQMGNFSNTLNLSHTQLSDRGMAMLSEIENVRSLQLGGNSALTNVACSSISKISTLRELQITLKPITATGFKSLVKLPHLQSLSMNHSTGLSGSMLAELKTLQSLQRLEAKYTDMDDSAVPHLANLSSLRLLNLVGTKVSNEAVLRLKSRLPNCSIIHPAIPTNSADRRAVQWAVENSGLVTIETANRLGHEKLTEKKDLNIPFAVNTIEFNMNSSPTGDLSNLEGLHSIKYLNYPNLKEADKKLASLRKLTSLQSLFIESSDVSVAGFDHLKGLSQLEQLALAKCKNVSDDALARLSPFKHLWLLICAQTSVTDKGLADLSQLSNLGHLSFDLCPNIKGSGLKHLIPLKRLYYLSIVKTPINDEAIPYLQQIKSLRVLNISKTKITAEGAAKLQADLPNCVIFHESLENMPSQSSP